MLRTLKTLKVVNPESRSRHNQITIVEKADLDKYFIQQGLKISELKKRFGLTTRILYNSLKYHNYSPELLKAVKTKKLIQRNRGRSGGIGWENKSTQLEEFFPGFSLKFKALYEAGLYEDCYLYLQKIWEGQFKIKLALKCLRTSVKGRLKGKTDLHLGSVSNQSEYVVKEILEKLGLVVLPQFPLGKYTYDFLIKKHNLIIEVNGSQFHTPEFDKPKLDYAREAGYGLCVLELQKMKKENYEKFVSNKIRKALGFKKSL